MDNKSTSYLNPAAIVSMDMRDFELAGVIKPVFGGRLLRFKSKSKLGFLLDENLNVYGVMMLKLAKKKVFLFMMRL